MIRCAALLVVFCLLQPAAARAQGVDGYVSVLGDVLPTLLDDLGARQPVTELRSRLFAEYRRDLGQRIRVTAAGFAEALIADRGEPQVTRAAIVRPQELHVEAAWPHADLRVGYSRVAWGRLDEFLPTDVVNPQDLTRFFLEGRSEARMAVAMVRGRWLPADAFTLEGIYVPVFRPGSFDQLDEESAPFNLAPRTVCPRIGFGFCTIVDLRRTEPVTALRNAQGGLRASVTTGRVDWSISGYRGFEPFPVYRLARASGIGPAPQLEIEEQFPRFSMIGADFETVRGEWGVRGEVAGFVERTLQAPVLDPIAGRTLEGGIGIDRKAGAYRVSGNVILSKRWVRDPAATTAAIDRTDVIVVAAVDRSFSRETRTVRVFGVYNPGERSAFARAIGAISMRDNVWFEGSVGWFNGSGVDALSRLAERDFLYARLKVFF